MKTLHSTTVGKWSGLADGPAHLGPFADGPFRRWSGTYARIKPSNTTFPWFLRAPIANSLILYFCRVSSLKISGIPDILDFPEITDIPDCIKRVIVRNRFFEKQLRNKTNIGIQICPFYPDISISYPFSGYYGIGGHVKRQFMVMPKDIFLVMPKDKKRHVKRRKCHPKRHFL